MLRRFKVLPLLFPFDAEKLFWGNCVRDEDRIAPRFNRDGYYLDRQTKTTWLEKDGEAWVYGNAERFQYDLAISAGNNRIPDHIFQALATLFTCHNMSYRSHPDLYRQWTIEQDIRRLREIRLDAQKFRFDRERR